MREATSFNPHIRCFAPEQLSVAYAYLGLDACERARAAGLLERLQKEVD